MNKQMQKRSNALSIFDDEVVGFAHMVLQFLEDQGMTLGEFARLCGKRDASGFNIHAMATQKYIRRSTVEAACRAIIKIDHEHAGANFLLRKLCGLPELQYVKKAPAQAEQVQESPKSEADLQDCLESEVIELERKAALLERKKIALEKIQSYS
jgi:hypothetical protein